jgi:hypothetical protein
MAASKQRPIWSIDHARNSNTINRNEVNSSPFQNALPNHFELSSTHEATNGPMTNAIQIIPDSEQANEFRKKCISLFEWLLYGTSALLGY